jgi:type I restriction enzyme, S subunit
LKGEVESRIDPNFYKLEFQTLLEKIKRNNYKRLGEIVEFSSESWNQIDFFDDYFPYIEISEINIISGEIKNISLISKNDAASRAKMIVREDDIIVSSTRPNRGAIAKIDKISDFSIASTGFAVLRKLKTNQLSREFLFFILRQKLCLTQMEQRSSGGNYPAITQEELSNILIPILQEKTEQTIINIFEKAYATKKAKEAQAKAILASIDEYLLKELGIILPEKQESSLKNRVFLRNISEVSGGRLDAGFYSNQRIIIEGGNYENIKLEQLAFIQKGQSITKESIVKGDYPVIAGGQSSPYSHNQYNFLENVITVSASGAYAGYVWFHNYSIFASDCCAIRSKNEEVVNTLFLFELLKLKQQEIYGLQQGAAQPHIYASDLSKLMMPLPPLEIQERIVNHIQSIRDKAKALENEAKEILEKAKAEVERMILGE